MTTTSVFHEGERSVQERAGVAETSAELGARVIHRSLSAGFRRFLAAQSFVIVASGPPPGPMWASILTGPAGFARADRPDRVLIDAAVQGSDPLARSLQGGGPLGLLILDPASRRRIRVNGVGRRTPAGLELEVREAFGNCPKYIQRRRLREPPDGPRDDGAVDTSTSLDAGQRRMVRAADTFFIASRHPGRGADASHRGGRPGFVGVADDGTSLTFPDYRGNNLFQTLGNVLVDPAVGLLFVDWGTGRALQLTGRAEVIWDAARLVAWPGARRLIEVRVQSVVDRPHGSGLGWEFVESHPFNPRPPRALDRGAGSC